MLSDDTFVVSIHVNQKWKVDLIDDGIVYFKNRNVTIKLSENVVNNRFHKINNEMDKSLGKMAKESSQMSLK